MQTLKTLPQLPAPLRDDARINLAFARAAESLARIWKRYRKKLSTAGSD
jgi:hypothetical protein